MSLAPVPMVTFPGLGTLINAATVVVGSLVGLAVGSRLSERTRTTITDVLGLVTMVIGAQAIIPISGAPLTAATGNLALIVILLSLLAGGIVGSRIDVEGRLAQLGDAAQARLARRGGDSRFANAFVTSTLVFCVGPLGILGGIDDGLGRGPQQLVLKATLDLFGSMAFASALGAGVLLAAASVLVYEAAWTLVGVLLGSVLPPAAIDAIGVTGGVVMLGLSVRLLDLKPIRVADLLPALVVAPLAVLAVQALR